jgi:hypothetical protein
VVPGITEETVPVEAIDLAPLSQTIMEIHIEGSTPLIVNSFGEKARREMLAAMQVTGTTKRKSKSVRNPQEDYQQARHLLSDGRDGLPAAAFKAAIVNAARYFAAVSMEQLKSAVTVLPDEGDLVWIEGQATMREDYVRVGNGLNKTTDLRYRPEFTKWKATLHVRYIAEVLTANSIVALVDAAGFGGVGEWRPTSPKAKNGSYGTFHVVRG